MALGFFSNLSWDITHDISSDEQAPKVLGNSQRDNRPLDQHSSNHAASFLSMLTPPRKDDLRPNHLFPKGPGKCLFF